MCLLDLKNEKSCVIKIMSGQTKIVGTHRRVVLTGVTREPAWSELSGKKLTFVRYAKR